MGTSNEALQAQIMAMGQKNLMGMPVSSSQVDQILNMCSNQQDKAVLRQLCDSFGLKYTK